MRLVLFIGLIWCCSGCKGQAHKKRERIEYVRNYNYKITVDVGSSFWNARTRYVLDNNAIGLYDSLDERNGRFKPFVLYYITLSNKEDINGSAKRMLLPLDTIEIQFSKENSDKLFALTRDFFEKLTFNNIDTLTNGSKTELVVTDDASAFVELGFGGREIYASISSISNPAISTKEFDALLAFIQKFKPERQR